MPKLPSFRRFLLISFFLLALLASAFYLLAGGEIEVPPKLEMAICSALEDCDSWISRAASTWRAPSAARDLGSSGAGRSDGRSPASALDAASSSSSGSVILDFNSSVSESLFRTWGRLTFQGGPPLPYLILNATLWDEDQLVEGTRYMIMGVEPGEGRDFDIRESCRLSPERGYSCLLEVEEAGGPLEGPASGRRDCLVMESDPDIVIREEGGAAYIGRVASEEEPAESPSVPEPAKAASNSYRSKPVERSQVETSQEVEDSSKELKSEKDSDSSSGEPKKTDPEAEIGCKYVGSTTSNKYHRPDCRYAEKIREENRICFLRAEDAQEAGYSPCKVCNPG